MFRNLLVLISILSYQATFAENDLTRVGYAYDLEDKGLLYSEYHYESINQDLVRQSSVIYKDSKGEVFAEKKVNFEIRPFLPEFKLMNEATGHLESTAYIKNEYKVRFLEKVNDKLKEKLLNYSEDAISDAGFDNFVMSHWQQIISGEQFTRDFLIPGMLRFFKFRIYQKEIAEEAGEKYRVLVIEPDSFLIRQFTRASRLYYAFDKPELKRFEGISNMRDAEGKNYTVLIKYETSTKLASAKNIAE